MTVGEYPQKVPAAYRIPLDRYRSATTVGRFRNVAKQVGLTSRGPTMAGGSIFDDFTGDGLPDLFTTSLEVDRGASLFVNLGNGQFDYRGQSAGLAGQIYAFNLSLILTTTGISMSCFCVAAGSRSRRCRCCEIQEAAYSRT